MADNKKTSVEDRRSSPRIPLEGAVMIRILQGQLLGSTTDVSGDGMFMLAQGEIPVEVIISRLHPPFRGRLVRVLPVNDKTCGIGIRFDEDQPPLPLPQDDPTDAPPAA